MGIFKSQTTYIIVFYGKRTVVGFKKINVFINRIIELFS